MRRQYYAFDRKENKVHVFTGSRPKWELNRWVLYDLFDRQVIDSDKAQSLLTQNPDAVVVHEGRYERW